MDNSRRTYNSQVGPVAAAEMKLWLSQIGRSASLFLFLYVSVLLHQPVAATTVTITPAQSLSSAVNNLQAGDTLILRAGTYRDSMLLPNRSWSAGQPTTIKAAPGESVSIMGSDIVSGWTSLGSGKWVKSNWTSNSQQVFVNDTILQQIGGHLPNITPDTCANGNYECGSYVDITGGAWPGRIDGDQNSLTTDSFYYDSAANKLYVKVLSSLDLNQQQVEVSVRRWWLFGDGVKGLNVKDLTFIHCNTSGFSRGSSFLLLDSHNNVIENITCLWSDSFAITIRGNDNVVKNSTLMNSGQTGIGGSGFRNKILNNVVRDNNYRNFNRAWAAGGMKFIGGKEINQQYGGPDGGLIDSEISGNKAIFNNGGGIWLDFSGPGNKIHDNIAAYNNYWGIHIEVMRENYIFNNYVFGNNGAGVTVPENQDTVVAHNLIITSDSSGINWLDQDRKGVDYPDRNQILGNLVGWSKNAEQLTARAIKANKSDYNLYLENTLPTFRQRTLGTSTGLDAWRIATGLDMNSGSEQRALPLSIQNDLIAQTVNIDWTPLFDIANNYTVIGSDINGVSIGNLPPGPNSDPSGKPRAPSDPNALAISFTQINLNWRDNSSTEESFKIRRAFDSSFINSVAFIVGPNITTFSDLNLTPNTTYYYKVKAENATFGDSAYTDPPVSITTRPPPNSPSNMVATANSFYQIDLTWTDNSADEDGFQIDRRQSPIVTWLPLTSLGVAASSYSDTGLPDGTKFYYRVRSFNATNGNSAWSNIDTATTVAGYTPAAPSNLVANAISNTEVALTWSDNSDNEENFKIRRSLKTNFVVGVELIIPFNQSSYVDSGLDQNTTFYYKIKAEHATFGDSAYTDPPVSANTAEQFPTSPSGLTFSLLSSSQVELVWKDNSDIEEGYDLERSPGGTNNFNLVSSLSANQTTYTQTGLSENTSYQYRVKATHSTLGDSGYTPILTLTTPVVRSNTEEIRVASGNSDAEEYLDGTMDVYSTDLEMVDDTVTDTNRFQVVGIRFVGLNVPAGATVEKAYVQFKVDETESIATSLTIRGEASDSAADYSSAAGNLTSRATTTNSVVWAPPAWNTVGEEGADQQTPDLTAVLQEIVDRTGWHSGNSLALVITGTGKRIAESYDGDSSGAPLLHIEYSVSINSQETRIASGSDDAEEYLDGSMDINSTDLEMVDDTVTDPNRFQVVGIRFTGLNVLTGATIEKAYVQFKVDETESIATSLTIRGEASDSAAAYSLAAGNLTSRATTANSVVWTPTAWNTLDERGMDQQTPDLTAVLQEIVDRAGWQSGNSLALVITGTGKRIAASYEGDSFGAPLLHIEFSGGYLDTDNDHIPDASEGGNTPFVVGVDDETVDSDGDGVSNSDEFNTGFNASDPSESFVIRDPNMDSSGDFYLTIPTSTGKNFEVEYSDVFPPVWQQLIVLAGDGSDQIVIDLSPPVSRRYYRVRIQ